MLSSFQLKQIVAEARPLIERQLDLAFQIAALRTVVTEAGGDWSQLKALIKAQVQDEQADDPKRVERILEKADYAKIYADMLGLGRTNMNEKNKTLQEGSEPIEVHTLDRASSTLAPATPSPEPNVPAIETGNPVSTEQTVLDEGEGQHGAQSLPDTSQADPDKSAGAPATAAPIRKKAYRFEDKAHPDCLNPEQCGGFSNHGLCERCKAVAA